LFLLLAYYCWRHEVCRKYLVPMATKLLLLPVGSGSSGQ
jgi:hypothetical protein